jgi:DNA-directed RNA polymerase II subunit RPB1
MQESTILGIQFGIFSPEEIRKSSVAEITRRDTYVNNKAVVGGMFDTRMGILEPGLICPTDGLDYIQCPGYFGHIELAKPVFYIQYLDTVVNIAQCICIKCSKLLINKEKYSSFLSLPSDKRWKQVHALCHKITRCGESSEMGCGCKQPTKYKQEGFSTIIAEWKVPDTPPISLKVTPEMFIKIFRRISDDDISFMGFSPLWSRPEWMICQVLAVPPPSVRPSVKYDSAQRSEDDLTYILVQIIKANETLKGKIALDASPSTIDDYHSVLQFFIATLVDNKIPNAKPAAQRSGRAFKSIKDRLNGKTGRVRGNLMGKRVDFSARSVITPDPNLSIRELGVPIKIAQNITKPVTVNSRNIHSLNALVKNGPDVYPGAKLLERTINGKTIHISLKYADRESIQLNEGDIVHRHMMDGDVILFNRQPTLHRMSMMGHVVRVMFKGDTFRMNVGDTKPYNADFDGDEMNLHMPQTLEAETELRHLAAVPYQIISPASNQSIIGIFQDSLLGSFQFTRPNINFDPLTAMNMVVNLPQVDETIFQQERITNFEILSMILPPMSSFQKTKMFKDSEDVNTSNNIIEIADGVYKRGQLDKGALSATSKGLIHRIFNDYGNFASADFIDNIQYIVNEYMKLSSYSVGISDLLTSDTVQDKIKEVILKKKDEINRLIGQTHLNLFENETGKTNVEELEYKINALLGVANNDAGKLGKNDLSPQNRFVLMVQAGSKGSDINISQMVACLGQQQVEGKRVPYGFDDRSLPHFTKYDDMPEARGFVESSFIKGLNPFELFFHAQGGRIGLIDTAVKTSTTGYIQRRLIKSMEDCISLYDGTVRNHKNKIIQFSYGEDNIDPAKVEAYHMPLCELKMEQIYNHYNMNVESVKFSKSATQRNKEQASECAAKCKFWIDYMLNARHLLISKVFDYKNEYKIHVPVGIPYLISHLSKQFHLSPQTVVDLTPFDAFELLDLYYAKLESLGPYKPSEMFKIVYYYSLSPRELLLTKHYTKAAVIMLLEQIVMHYKRALIQPGEMVGIIAAQSIGEPTTQMTLNTFHFAGVASKSNVTRGVPRIEEILSLSANTKNPSVTVRLKEVDETSKERAQYFMTLLEHTKLADITIKADICFENEPLAEDKFFVRRVKEFNELFDDCGVEDRPDTPWVIRLELNAEEMLNRNITMDDVNFAIKQNENFKTVPCVYSDYNDDKLVFRISPNDPKKSKNKSSVFYDMDYVYNLKETQTKLMNVVLRGVKDIKKVNIRTVKNNVKHVNGNYDTQEIWVLDTVGTNLLDLLGVEYIDSRRTISNDIRETNDVLGIEAARESIYTELTEVIEFDGAYINDHHKSLLCDRMTSTHPMMSVCRHGVNKDNIGPIAKASFEETPEMFFRAAMHGELDEMRGISANIMTGQEGYYGTASFGLLLDMNKITPLQVKKPTVFKEEQTFSKSACDTIQIHNNLGEISKTKKTEDVDYMINLF